MGNVEQPSTTFTGPLVWGGEKRFFVELRNVPEHKLPINLYHAIKALLIWLEHSEFWTN